MSNLKEKAERCYHLAKQLNEECGSLFADMTVETKKNNIPELTEFQFVKHVMKTSALLEPLSYQLKDVYLALGLIALRQPGFAQKIKQDMDETQAALEDIYGSCPCAECQKASEDVIAQALEIVKKENEK